MATRQSILASLTSEIQGLTEYLRGRRDEDPARLALLQTYMDSRNKLLEKDNAMNTVILETQNTLNQYQRKLEFFLSERIRVSAELRGTVYNSELVASPLETIDGQIKMYEGLVQTTQKTLEKYLSLVQSPTDGTH